MAKYKLKEGVVLKPYGDRSIITDENITDEIVEFLISTGKAKESDFEKESKDKK
jgi:Mg2+/Co2+ transporter CorB